MSLNLTVSTYLHPTYIAESTYGGASADRVVSPEVT